MFKNLFINIKNIIKRRLNKEILISKENPQEYIIQNPIHHNSIENINAIYSNPGFVESYLNQERISFYKDVVNFLKDKYCIDYNNKNIADVGCGTGHLLLYLRDTYSLNSITGFDGSEAAVQIARKNIPSATFICFDIYTKPNKENKFDVLFCTEVLEHLLYPERAINTIISMINQPGIAMITVPNGRIDTYDGHIYFWSPESWEVFMSNYSNDLIKIETGLLCGNSLYAVIKKPLLP